ncbi:hypothetical protein DV736_g1503, partial [Chaetothyriales sp. CBS 134916]
MDLSFLYQTRTILRLSRAGATPLRPSRTQIRKVSIDSRSLLARPPPSQPKDDVDSKTKFFRPQAERRAMAAAGEPEPELPKPVITSTITPDEQRAFARLHEVALRQQAGLPPWESGRLNGNPESIFGLFAGPGQRRHESQPEGYEAEHPGSGDFTPNQASVYSWAKEGYQQLEAVTTTQPRSDPTEDAVAKFCNHQMRDYYRSFNEALHSTTVCRDVAVLDILQKQIFPLLELIRPPSPSPSAEPSTASGSLNGQISESPRPSKHSKVKKKTKASHSSVNEAILTLTSTSNPTASPLAIVSRLYPAATLLALRLLTKHQPLSPMTSSLLSTIRDLGPTSYVLAANTHFYNTFLFLRWNVSSSLSEICALLSEMERGAVEFDKGTAAFLADVAEEKARDLYTAGNDDRAALTATTMTNLGVGSGERRGAQWWRRQQQEKWWPRIEEWRILIARRLESSGISSDEDGMRERPYSSLMSQRAEDRGLGRWASPVWL